MIVVFRQSLIVKDFLSNIEKNNPYLKTIFYPISTEPRS